MNNFNHYQFEFVDLFYISNLHNLRLHVQFTSYESAAITQKLAAATIASVRFWQGCHRQKQWPIDVSLLSLQGSNV